MSHGKKHVNLQELKRKTRALIAHFSRRKKEKKYKGM